MCFLAGFGSVLAFWSPAKMHSPFEYGKESMGRDWQFIGEDLAMLLENKQQEKHEPEKNIQ